MKTPNIRLMGRLVNVQGLCIHLQHLAALAIFVEPEKKKHL
jgi:hypothetical protein